MAISLSEDCRDLFPLLCLSKNKTHGTKRSSRVWSRWYRRQLGDDATWRADMALDTTKKDENLFKTALREDSLPSCQRGIQISNVKEHVM